MLNIVGNGFNVSLLLLLYISGLSSRFADRHAAHACGHLPRHQFCSVLIHVAFVGHPLVGVVGTIGVPSISLHPRDACSTRSHSLSPPCHAVAMMLQDMIAVAVELDVRVILQISVDDVRICVGEIWINSAATDAGS